MKNEKYIEAHIVQDGSETKCILPDTIFSSAKAGSLYDSPTTDHRAAPTPEILPEEKTAGFPWAPWGDDDCLPTIIRQKLYAVPMATRAIYQLTQMMYGNGLAYYRNSDLLKGKKVQRAYIPEIERWLNRNRIRSYWLPAQLMDYRFYMNSFSELIFNRTRTQITNLYHKKAEFSRLSIQNPNTGQIEDLYYSPRFADGVRPTEKEIRKVQLFDWYNEEDFLDKITGYKFAWHSYFPTPGTEYYARPLWLGLFVKDGWLDVSAAVPRIISSMQHNQLVLKYHILIPESYYKIRHPDWEGYTKAQRDKIIRKHIKTINDSLRGVDNIYTSILTVFRQDFNNSGQAEGRIEIIPIDDKLKKDQWVPSSEKADAQIVQGLGQHPSQIGLQPNGGKMGAGSGSDQRESFNTGISLNTLDQMIELEPLNWAARFNAQSNTNWDVTFFIDHTHHTTTNDQESGLKPSATSIQTE